MIELKNISIKTRHSILTDTTYAFHENKIYGIVAENGSGKTTLFRTMVNLKKAKAGTILFDKCKVENKLKDIFYFENVEWLDKNLSGYDYLKFVKKMWKSDLELEEVIEKWNMGEYIKLPIKKYSLGMKQRVIIGIYIISNAKYLIMDEITNGLDEDNRKLFFDQIQLLRDQGKVILISSHYKDEIVSYCDIVLRISNSTLIEGTL